MLDSGCESYEHAIRAGRVKLPPERAGDNDPWLGRSLNPHRKSGAFCKILRHAGLLNLLRLLMGREPKALQTIASQPST